MRTILIICSILSIALMGCSNGGGESASVQEYYSAAIAWQVDMIEDCGISNTQRTTYAIPEDQDFSEVVVDSIYADGSLPEHDGLPAVMSYDFPTACQISDTGLYNNCRGHASWIYNQIRKANIVPDDSLRIRIFDCGSLAHADVVIRAKNGEWYLWVYKTIKAPSGRVFTLDYGLMTQAQYMTHKSEEFGKMNPVYDFNLFDAGRPSEW